MAFLGSRPPRGKSLVYYSTMVMAGNIQARPDRQRHEKAAGNVY